MRISFSGHNAPITNSTLFSRPEFTVGIHKIINRSLKPNKRLKIFVAGASDRTKAIETVLATAQAVKKNRSLQSKNDPSRYVYQAGKLLDIDGLEIQKQLVLPQQQGYYWLVPDDIKYCNNVGVLSMLKRHLKRSAITSSDIQNLKHPGLPDLDKVRVYIKRLKPDASETEIKELLSKNLWLGYSPHYFDSPFKLSNTLHQAAGRHRQGCIIEDAKRRSSEPKQSEVVHFANVAHYLKPEDLEAFVGNTASRLNEGSLFVLGLNDPQTNMRPFQPESMRLDLMLKKNGLVPHPDSPQWNDPIEEKRTSRNLPVERALVWVKR